MHGLGLGRGAEEPRDGRVPSFSAWAAKARYFGWPATPRRRLPSGALRSCSCSFLPWFVLRSDREAKAPSSAGLCGSSRRTQASAEGGHTPCAAGSGPCSASGHRDAAALEQGALEPVALDERLEQPGGGGSASFSACSRSRCACATRKAVDLPTRNFSVSARSFFSWSRRVAAVAATCSRRRPASIQAPRTSTSTSCARFSSESAARRARGWRGSRRPGRRGCRRQAQRQAGRQVVPVRRGRELSPKEAA